MASARTPEPLDLAAYRAWDAPALVVAEAGVNHEGKLETALELVRQAAAAGAAAIKFQTYKAGRLATRASRAYWDETKESTAGQFELFSKYDSFGPDDYRRIAQTAADAGIAFVTTPFDVDAVAWLDELVRGFKIASGDITNVPLLRRIGSTGKPVLLSTGASTIDEVREAVDCLRSSGANEIAVLQCTLAYPTPTEHASVGALRELGEEFPDCVLGYSDHTIPPDSLPVIAAAYALGARVIETHFTLDRSLPGNDHYHALDPGDLAQLVGELDRLRTLIGPPEKRILPIEEPAREGARRSLVARVDIPRGTQLAPGLLDVKRPGGGVPPAALDEIAAWTAVQDIPEDTTIEWGMLVRDGG
jgi:N-acetylneuraminate synthase